MTDKKRVKELTRTDGRTALLVLSVSALIVVDLTRPSVATGLGAAALALFTVAYLTWWQSSRAGLYGFLIAELSPLGLQADLLTAGVYQAFCVLFLSAAIAPLPRVAPLRTYARPAALTLVIAGGALAFGWALVTATSLSLLQASSLVGIGILGTLTVLVYTQRDTVKSVQGA